MGIDLVSQALTSALVRIAGDRGLAIAVSGGVDSLTLMAFSHRWNPKGVIAYHAISPAVPPAATTRVREIAERVGFDVVMIDAGETQDDEYLNNPVDRCRVCKSHLYDAIASVTKSQVISGTNLDDMEDYRPGLEAARARGVLHPFVEAKMTKDHVRALARDMGLHDVSELPAQPCLSSRVETGIRITPDILERVNAAEDAVRALLGNDVTVRCRVRKTGFNVEVGRERLEALDDATRAVLLQRAQDAVQGAVELSPYRQGSAFLRVVA